MQLVNHLFERGEIDAAARSHLERQAKAWGVAAHPLLRTFQMIPSEVYLARYESVFRCRRVLPAELKFCEELGARVPWEIWRRALAVPVFLGDGTPAIAATDPISLPSELRQLGVTTTLILEEEWVELATEFFSAQFMDEAVNGLARRHPEMSARRTFTTPQLGALWSGGTVILACL